MYKLNNLPFIKSIDDNVVIDEFVWENTNALLMTNPNWIGVSLYSPIPGKFVLRGYLQTLDQMQSLADLHEHELPLSGQAGKPGRGRDEPRRRRSRACWSPKDSAG